MTTMNIISVHSWVIKRRGSLHRNTGTTDPFRSQRLDNWGAQHQNDTTSYPRGASACLLGHWIDNGRTELYSHRP
jgi:hypothetical protein